MVRGWPGVLQLPLSRDTAYNPPPSQHTDADGWAWSISVRRVGSRGLQFTTEGLQVWSRRRVGSMDSLNPTLAPLLALALPGCRSIGPVHPVSPLQKLNFSQSLPVHGELLDRSAAHGGEDGTNTIRCQLSKCFYFPVWCGVGGMIWHRLGKVGWKTRADF